jgi:hypothetical protein
MAAVIPIDRREPAPVAETELPLEEAYNLISLAHQSRSQEEARPFIAQALQETFKFLAEAQKIPSSGDDRRVMDESV